MHLISSQEAADRWGISKRRVQTLCAQGRINGAEKVGTQWVLPDGVEKPNDARIVTGKYIKKQ